MRRGRNQFIGTFEYTYVLQPVRAFTVAGLNLYAGLQLVGFGDLGLAWNDASDPEASPALDGYGFGLRVLVPFVDVIRLDVAWGEPDRAPPPTSACRSKPRASGSACGSLDYGRAAQA